MIAHHQIRAATARTLLPMVLEPLVLTPRDGARYRVMSALISEDPPTRFFGIGRDNGELLGELLTGWPELSLVAYVERFGQWHDLELLWAGWRVFLYLCGRPDQAPPPDLPRWRDDWFAPLAALPIASYQVGPHTIQLRRTGPRAFAATVADRAGRPTSAVLSAASAAAALASAEHSLLEDAALIAV